MANKTRVQVRGTIGKSVRINTPATAAQTAKAVAGVEITLPDGSTQTLAQLAAAIAAMSNQPGNIASPIGGTPVIFSQVQYVPPNVLYQSRYVASEDDYGEDRMIVPGPIGLTGPRGLPAPLLYPDDPDDPLIIPGPQGLQGVQGPPGTGGTGGGGAIIHNYNDDTEDPLPPIPGPIGLTGPAGAPGVTGPGAIVQTFADDPEDPLQFPGVPGPRGATGLTGAAGIVIPMYAEDADDVSPIPGQQGLQGAQGAPGIAGLIIDRYPEDPDDPYPPVPGQQGIQGLTGAVGPAGIPIYLPADDPDDVLYIPGAQGPQGAQGIPGSSGSSAGGWAAQFQEDNFEDPLSALRNVPGDLFVRSLSIGSPPTAYPLYAYVASGPVAAFTSQGGIIISGPAATQDNFLTFGQSGQSTWQLYALASSNDMHWFNNSLGDHTVWFGGGGAQMNLNNSNYGAGAGAVAGLILENSSTTMQSTLEFQKAGVVMGRVRADYAGNMTYVSTAGAHAFFVGGDSGVGGEVAILGASYGFQTNTWRNIATTGLIDWSPTTYGTMRISGGIAGGYTGIMVNDGTFGPTLMANSTAAGIYNQTAGRWLIYDDGTNVNINSASRPTKVLGTFAINGATPPNAPSGFGTPTGAAIIANFPGASASAVQTSETVAYLLLLLKSMGFISA